MDIRIWQVLLCLGVVCPSLCTDVDSDSDFQEDRWSSRNSRQREKDTVCVKQKPPPRDIVRRIYAILLYFNKDHLNTAFLRKFRGTIYEMSEGDDILDREIAFYAAILTPLVFLHQYRDIWCLLERFHRALRLYQISDPTEKRSALKFLQNLRFVHKKIHSLVLELPGSTHPTRTTPQKELEDEEIHDSKDIRYLKELIKNLG